MKKFFQRLWKKFYGGKDRSFFLENRDSIVKYDLKIIAITIIIMIIASFAYLFINFPQDTHHYLKIACLVYLLVFAILLLFHYLIFKFETKFPTLYYIVITEIIFTFLLLVGPIYDSTHIACFIPVFLLGYFILTINPFHKLLIINLINLAAFIVIDFIWKDISLVKIDILNSCITFILGAAVGINILEARVSQIDRYHALKQETDSELSKALLAANNDALTGALTRSAYQTTESTINKIIADKKKIEFAVISVDINRLKEINDTSGHHEGDKVIIKSFKEMSEIFKGSKIFRIGGDEFVIVVQNENYENRKTLMSKMARSKLYAAGIAVYDENKDKSFIDVFERADRNMYKIKNNR